MLTAKKLAWFLFPATTLLLGQPVLTENLTDLRSLSIQLGQRHLTESEAAVRQANFIGMPIRCTLPNGRVTQLQLFAGGRPYYYITTNFNAARSVGTDKVWPGGNLGLNLTGYGNIVGIWDEGSILPTHQELTGRIVRADYATSLSNHATHVAGTVIAEGFVTTAHGMAPEAEVWSYDWNSDASEVIAAAADGLVISNHSYSYIAGWQLDIPENGWNWWGDVAVDSREDYLFGFYDSTAFYWDQIAYNAPHLLIVTAAGNDRGDQGPAAGELHWVLEGTNWIQSSQIRDPDGDYDCLPGGCQVAKNVLVVGAVEDLPTGYTDNSDVTVLDFSSRGPTDDGRIKPDIVANGWEVFSAVAAGNDSYDHFTGTSMAAPNVAGSIALLNQHYADTHSGPSPLASSLRAAIIHTAHATGGSIGPDYDYGWGLLNTAGAALLILQDSQDSRIIQELELIANESLTVDVFCDGSTPIKVTLAWTDPPGAVPIAQLDPQTPNLTNDLDLRIAGDDDTIYLPWILNAAAPMMPAVRGDNTSDNIEQVYIESPPIGNYSISVSHKGTLATGKQSFSMIVSGISFDPVPQVLVWEGDSVAVDHSGTYIRDELLASGMVDVNYTTEFPTSLTGYNAVFLSFGPSGALSKRTYFDNLKADSIRFYLEEGGSLYLEGGDALGVDQANNDTLLSLLGIALAEDMNTHSINWLQGQPGTLTEGMLFTASTQESYEYPDIYFSGTGAAAFDESDLGTVAVQNTGIHHQKTFTFSYALANLVDGASPNTRRELLRKIMNFLMEEPPAPPNSPPIAVNDFAEVLEDSSSIIFPLENDSDTDGHELRLFSLFNGFYGLPTILDGDTAIRYVPARDYYGSDSFYYAVSDSRGGIDTALVLVSVLPVNDPPVAKDDSIEIIEDIPCSIPVIANDCDIDGDSLTIAAVTDGNHGYCVIEEGSRSITYTPDINYAGEDKFGYVLDDSHGGLALASVHVTVIGENDPVVAVSDTITTMEDIPVSIDVLANDLDCDDDSLTIVEIGIPDYGEARLVQDGVISYHPVLNYFGGDEFQYVVTDNGFVLDTAHVMITILPINDAPKPFNLLEPLGDTTQVIIDPGLLSDSLVMRWEQSNDVEMDTVYYIFQTSNDTIANVMDLSQLSAPQVILQHEYLAIRMISLGIHSSVGGNWTILATDGTDSTAACNGPFWMILDVRLLGIANTRNVPDEFAFHQNYPNPFNPSTSLAFDLPERTDVDLVIYNLRGEEVIKLVNEQLPAGKHQIIWNGKLRNGREAPSGLYICIIHTPNEVACRKMVLLR